MLKCQIEKVKVGLHMAKSLFISEKPSVAQEFAKALKRNFKRKDGYLEAEDCVVTWCYGHLVMMSYPETYDPTLKRTLEERENIFIV